MLPYQRNGDLLPGVTLQTVNVRAPQGWEKNPTPTPDQSQFRSPDGRVFVSLEGVMGPPMSTYDRVIDIVAGTESRGAGGYAAWTPNDRGAGVSAGFVQFNQHKGSLDKLFQEMHAQNPTKFAAYLGSDASIFLVSDWVKSPTTNLNQRRWPEIFSQMAKEPDFIRAQRVVAKREYYDPAVAIMKEHRWTSERALVMLTDACIQIGAGHTKKLADQVARQGGSEFQALAHFSLLADKVPGVSKPRRGCILRDMALSDGPPVGGGRELEWFRMRIRVSGRTIPTAADRSLAHQTFLPCYREMKTVTITGEHPGSYVWCRR